MFTTLGATFLMIGAKLVVALVSRDRGAGSSFSFGGAEASVFLSEDASITATVAAPTVPARSRPKNCFPILFIAFLVHFGRRDCRAAAHVLDSNPWRLFQIEHKICVITTSPLRWFSVWPFRPSPGAP